MDRNLSRRRLLQIGALGAVGATAGCMERLPNNVRCTIEPPTTFTFTPTPPLDELAEENSTNTNESDDNSTDELTETESPDAETLLNRYQSKFVDVLSTRTQVAVNHGMFSDVEAAEVMDNGTTSFEFSESIQTPEDITYVVGSAGKLEITIAQGDADETTVFEATGDIVRPARGQETGDGWLVAVPLGPREKDDLQQALRDAGAAESESEYTFSTYLYGDRISERPMPPEGIEELLSDDWNPVLPISGLEKRDAVALLAHSQSEDPPADIEVGTSCRELDYKISSIQEPNDTDDAETTTPSGSPQTPSDDVTETPSGEE